MDLSQDILGNEDGNKLYHSRPLVLKIIQSKTLFVTISATYSMFFLQRGIK